MLIKVNVVDIGFKVYEVYFFLWEFVDFVKYKV